MTRYRFHDQPAAMREKEVHLHLHSEKDELAWAPRNMRSLLGEAINDVCAKYGVPQPYSEEAWRLTTTCALHGVRTGLVPVLGGRRLLGQRDGARRRDVDCLADAALHGEDGQAFGKA